MSVPLFCKYFHHDWCMEKAVKHHKLVSIKEINTSGDNWKNSKTSASHWVMGRDTCLPDHLSNKQAFSIFLMIMFAVLGFALYNTSDPPGFEKQHDHLEEKGVSCHSEMLLLLTLLSINTFCKALADCQGHSLPLSDLPNKQTKLFCKFCNRINLLWIAVSYILWMRRCPIDCSIE